MVDYDLFIEYQGTYHHGGEPFDNNNELHIKKLSEWKERSENHINSDYKEAIRVWTIKDPLKRSVAKNNKLNYLEIWSEENWNKFYNTNKEDLSDIAENLFDSNWVDGD